MAPLAMTSFQNVDDAACARPFFAASFPRLMNSLALLTVLLFASRSFVLFLVKDLGSTEGWEISFCPRMVVPSSSSAPNATRTFSSSTMLGTTTDSSGMRLTRLYSRMAASMDRKNMRAPAKKKLPTDPLT